MTSAGQHYHLRGQVLAADLPSKERTTSTQLLDLLTLSAEFNDSLWVTSGGTLLEIPLEPKLWVERANEVAGRDLTQAEWNLFVPGGGQVQSACR